MRFSAKLVLGVAVLSIVGMTTVFITVNTLVRDTIYDNVIAIAQRDKTIYAGEIDTWLTAAGQTVNSLAAALRALPSVEHFPAVAAGFTSDFGFVENVFIGFADGSVINGIGWTPSNVGDNLGGVGWGPWEYWNIIDRPWFAAAKAAGEGVMVVTDPYLSITTGNITAAIATWLPELSGVGASAGFSISLDFIEERLSEHPVMGGGYLMLIGADGTIIYHQNAVYSPCRYCSEGYMYNIRAIPNGEFLMDSLVAGMQLAGFEDPLLGPAYFIATHLETVNWTLIAVIPTAATLLSVYEDLAIIMAAFNIVVAVLLISTLFFVIFLTRNMEEKRIAEEKLRIIIDNMPLVANISGRDSNVIECNEEAPRLFGLRDKQEYIERFFELQPHLQPDGRESREKALAADDVAFETGKNRFEWMHKHINGELIPCEVTLIRVKWQGEDNLLSFVRDLREYYAARKKEQLVMQRMQAMLNSSPLACAILDENFNIIEANKKLVSLFELNGMQECVGKLLLDFSPKHQLDGRLSRIRWEEKAKLALETGKAYFEWTYQTPDEKAIPCEMTVVCITHDEKRLLIGYMQDLREINNVVSMAKRFETLALTDALTGARNRRYFDETAEKELSLSISEGRDFSIILFDIDNFKKINDTYGHDVGDEVLKIIVARTFHNVKQGTPVARYGGEEFIIMLPGVSHENAMRIAWEIQKKIEDSPFAAKGLEIAVTVSIGVASKTADCTTLSDIIKNTDNALYHAKKTSKNTVVSWKALKNDA